MASLLIVDDDLLFCEALNTTLAGEGYRVLVANTLATARELLKKQTFAVVFIDVFLPDGNGLDLLTGLALLPEPPEAIMVTAQGDPQRAESAITAGAWDYIQKPANMNEIKLMVRQALQAHERKKQMPDPAGTAGIVGTSRAIRLTLLQMFEAAQVDAPVLLTGETGTGKELVARAVHKNSHRAKGPFVVVDCSSIAPTLLESELFGNVRGAFTGAMSSRQGLAMLANGGTLFLDEVGELAPEQQKVFLRLLQERRFRPIGSTEELQSDFRVVAATNRNLAEMAAGGTFRSDLLFRLLGLTIDIPPLRNRGKDVFLLVQYALTRTLNQYGLKEKVFSSDALEAFASYLWPGNVRELLHAVEAAVLAARAEPLILMQHLPIHLRAQAVRLRIEEHSPTPRQAEAPPLSIVDRSRGGYATQNSIGQSVLPHDREVDPTSASAFGDDAQNSASRGTEPFRETAGSPGREALSAGGAARASAAGKMPFARSSRSAQTWKEFQRTVLYEQKRKYLLELLERAQGNVPDAAEAAGLSRQRLYILLREHGIMRHWEK